MFSFFEFLYVIGPGCSLLGFYNYCMIHVSPAWSSFHFLELCFDLGEIFIHCVFKCCFYSSYTSSSRIILFVVCLLLLLLLLSFLQCPPVLGVILTCPLPCLTPDWKNLWSFFFSYIPGLNALSQPHCQYCAAADIWQCFQFPQLFINQLCSQVIFQVTESVGLLSSTNGISWV